MIQTDTDVCEPNKFQKWFIKHEKKIVFGTGAVVLLTYIVASVKTGSKSNLAESASGWKFLRMDDGSYMTVYVDDVAKIIYDKHGTIIAN